MASQLKDRLPNRSLSGPELAEISRKELRGLLAVDPAFAPNIAYRSVAITVEARYDLGIPHPPHLLRSRAPALPVENLNGPKLLAIISEIFAGMVSGDYAFQGSVAYKRIEIVLTVTVHLGTPYEPKVSENVMCEVTGEAPLPAPLPEKAVVVALERKVLLENPNIDRINHDMPIIVQRATPPKQFAPDNQLSGEPPTVVMGSPGIENLEFRYDPTQFGSPAKPVDTDISQRAAARLGVPQQTGAVG